MKINDHTTALRPIRIHARIGLQQSLKYRFQITLFFITKLK